MKQFYVFILLSGFLLLTSSKINTTVFICKGKYSKKYHYKKNCRGLSNCSTQIFTVTLEEAKRIKRTLCGLED
jgi:hypothetical protein